MKSEAFLTGLINIQEKQHVFQTLQKLRSQRLNKNAKIHLFVFLNNA
jgi:hypothetical protein